MQSLALLALLEMLGVGRIPGPRRLGSVVIPEQVEKHRSLRCPRYDGCLDVALAAGWRSWTCSRCPIFELAKRFRATDTDHEAAARPFA